MSVKKVGVKVYSKPIFLWDLNIILFGSNKRRERKKSKKNKIKETGKITKKKPTPKNTERSTTTD